MGARISIGPLLRNGKALNVAAEEENPSNGTKICPGTGTAGNNCHTLHCSRIYHILIMGSFRAYGLSYLLAILAR